MFNPTHHPYLHLMQYKLVSAEERADLEQKVNALLKDGWELHGDTQVVPNDSALYFYQALVKK